MLSVFEYIEKLHSRIVQLTSEQEEWFRCGWECRIDVYRRVGAVEPRIIPSFVPPEAAISFRALYAAASTQPTSAAMDKAREREFQYQYRWLVAPYRLVFKARPPKEKDTVECNLSSSMPTSNFSTKGGSMGPLGTITAWPLGSQIVSTPRGYYYTCRSRDKSSEFVYDQNNEE